MTTKEKIIYEALKLFSVNGYEAVSTRDITRNLGMSDSAIYKHFKSKKEIFDSIIQICLDKFIAQAKKVEIENIDWNDLEGVCLDMFLFQTTDEWIVNFRKILVMEQFRNEEMYKLYRKMFVDIEVDNTTKIFSKLIEQGYVKKDLNPRVLAMELYAPFFMYHLSNDNNEKLYEELKTHISYLRRVIRV